MMLSCALVGHRYVPAPIGVYSHWNAKTNRPEQEQTYHMLYCTRCAVTREIVVARDQPDAPLMATVQG